MSIWVQRPDVDQLNALHEGTAVAHLGILITEVGDDYLRGTMPVDAHTRQPFGLLHGGAAALLAETLATAAGNHCVEVATEMCVGLELNCNHIRAARAGLVTGTAQPLHLGRRSHVWEIRTVDEDGRLVTAGRLTCTVVPRPE